MHLENEKLVGRIMRVRGSTWEQMHDAVVFSTSRNNRSLSSSTRSLRQSYQNNKDGLYYSDKKRLNRSLSSKNGIEGLNKKRLDSKSPSIAEIKLIANEKQGGQPKQFNKTVKLKLSNYG